MLVFNFIYPFFKGFLGLFANMKSSTEGLLIGLALPYQDAHTLNPICNITFHIFNLKFS